jgi:hypothetical protein
VPLKGFGLALRPRDADHETFVEAIDLNEDHVRPSALSPYSAPQTPNWRR